MVRTESYNFALHHWGSVSMRNAAWPCIFLFAAATCGGATAARAQVPVDFGSQMQRLQELVDYRYGEHHINVRTDYIGARNGDADPWYWMNGRAGAVWITLLERGANYNVVGWYLENGAQPILAAGGSVLFGENCRVGDRAAVMLERERTPFGFYLDAGGSGAGSPGEDHEGRERFFTNRLLNDSGPRRAGGIHPAPVDGSESLVSGLSGDVQALVFDVSGWTGRESWLVCFEDQDSGGRPGCHYWDSAGGYANDEAERHELNRRSPDNDFIDMVFEVRPDGATPAHSISFGALKLRYR